MMLRNGAQSQVCDTTTTSEIFGRNPYRAPSFPGGDAAGVYGNDDMVRRCETRLERLFGLEFSRTETDNPGRHQRGYIRRLDHRLGRHVC